MGEMGDIALMAMGFKMLYAVLAALLIEVMCRRMNRTIGVRMSEVVANIRRDSGAASLYFGLRILGLCILFGTIMG